jgi:transcription-repair coupling factor (superfamily II helicase)
MSFRLAAAFQKNQHFLLLVLDDAEQAAYFLNDFEQLLSSSEVLYFPASYRQPMLQKPLTKPTSCFVLKS